MPDLFAPEIAEIVEELERELRMREFVYPKLIEAGRLRPEVAERRIECLRRAIEILSP